MEPDQCPICGSYWKRFRYRLDGVCGKPGMICLNEFHDTPKPRKVERNHVSISNTHRVFNRNYHRYHKK